MLEKVENFYKAFLFLGLRFLYKCAIINKDKMTKVKKEVQKNGEIFDGCTCAFHAFP